MNGTVTPPLPRLFGIREKSALFLKIAVMVTFCIYAAEIIARVSDMEAKYLYSTIIFTLFAALLAIFPKHYVSISTALLITGCGIGAQFRVFTHGTLFNNVMIHYGGAMPELVVNVIDIPLILIALGALYYAAIEKRNLPRWEMFDTFVLLFMVSCIVSLGSAKNPALTYWELFRYVKYIILYFSLRILLSRYDLLKVIIPAFLVMLVLQSAVGLAQYFLGFQMPVRVGGVMEIGGETLAGTTFLRTTGLIGQGNGFAAWLLCPLAFALGSAFICIKTAYKTLAILIFIIGSLVLFTAFSRNGFLSYIVCCFIMFVNALLARRLKPSSVLIAGIIALIVVIVTFASGMGDIIFLRFFADDGGPTRSRLDLMAVAANMIASHPFSGIGLNNFDFVGNLYDPNGVTLLFNHPVHNIFLLVASETGVPGMLFFLGMGILLLHKSTRLAKKAQNETGYLIGSVITAVLVGLGFNGLIDYGMRQDLIIAELTILAAIIIHFSGLQKQNAPDLL